MTNIRTEVVALIADLDMQRGGPLTWTHASDGRPVTDAERELVESATREEFEAVLNYSKTAQDLYATRAADLDRIQQITKPYFESAVPDGATMGDVVKVMTEADRTEFLQVMERLSPDGTMEIPQGPIGRTAAHFTPYVTVDHDEDYGDQVSAQQLDAQIDRLYVAQPTAPPTELRYASYLREEDDEAILVVADRLKTLPRRDLEAALAYSAAEIVALNRALAQAMERGIALIREIAEHDDRNEEG